MTCPECGAECEDDSFECPECGAPLRGAGFDPKLDLVIVLETNNQIQLALATGLLEDAGIPYFALGRIATLVQDVDGLLHKWIRVQVPRDREEEARELLEPLMHPEEGPEESA